MSELEPLIADLALILICAGAMTLLFKRLRQPVVLGYIVAGFLASPNMPYMPSVTDMEGIHLWSEIGAAFVSYIIGHTVHWSGMLGIFVVLAIIFSILFSPRLKKQGERMTETFKENLTERERHEL